MFWFEINCGVRFNLFFKILFALKKQEIQFPLFPLNKKSKGNKSSFTHLWQSHYLLSFIFLFYSNAGGNRKSRGGESIRDRKSIGSNLFLTPLQPSALLDFISFHSCFFSLSPALFMTLMMLK
jgi:hypothetical protein